MDFLKRHGAVRATPGGGMPPAFMTEVISGYRTMLETGRTLDDSRDLSDHEKAELKRMVEKHGS